jgi:predicted Zn-dependent protease
MILVLFACACACSGPTWPRGVAPAPGANREQIASVQSAVDRWNEVAQEELGHAVLGFEQGDAVVWFDAGLDTCNGPPGRRGCAELGGRHVWLEWEGSAPERRLPVLAHELGHILGLDDQRGHDPRSIMGPGFLALEFSETDRANLHLLAQAHEG